MRSDKIICLCHDVELGLGHIDSEPEFAARVEAPARRALPEMLRLEKNAGIRATYHIVGCLLAELRDGIAGGDHSIGFHSFDHVLAADPLPSDGDGPGVEQLRRCREVDSEIRGYRPPQSKLTEDLSDEVLARYGIDWLASSGASLGLSRPAVVGGIVKIPIAFDDYALHTGEFDYPEWERRAFATLDRNDFTAFSLHDCYAPAWLPHYEAFLERIRSTGRFVTLDDLADQVLDGARS